ncbi:WD40/YVTN/BNR-like repeat-containing protein [Halalkalibacter urbisdiaboli]|uniref:WD40/YVTN/BNR-like repeat-containing protein n=1 Tax=Halalkalibacter urbisdiaboli TaxID=1960589 RepID=UPI001FDA34E6|nr:xyloglucanase [Halalkalibacter urbisdiaboli]
MVFSGFSFSTIVDAKTKAKKESYEWGRAKVVGGGFIPGIVFNETEEDLIYTRTDIGGAYRWDPDTNSWIQLMDFVSFDEWNLAGVDSLATDPVDPDRVYVAAGTYTNDWTTMNGAILRSQDRGDTWERTDLPFKVGGNMPGRSMGERLSIDPNDNSILYFGARGGHGLWRSTNYGETWEQVESFPATGNYLDYYGGEIGVVWITFDPNSGSKGEATQTIYAGVADTEKSIYRSLDGGQSWEALPGQPQQGYLPHHGILAVNGELVISYNENEGPYDGGQGGAVWKYNTNTGEWTDISPVQGEPYGGLAVDAKNPDVLMVATMNLWWPDDQIYRSTDGGQTWKPFWTLDWGEDLPRKNHFTIDYSVAPWLDWGQKGNAIEAQTGAEIQPKLGWMIGDLNIDPHNSDRIMYGTGATLYGSNNVTALDDEGGTVNLSVMAEGIEETAILGLISPPSGAPLLSAMGDIGGFRHEDVTKAPEMITNPYNGNSPDIDYAENNPNIVVRVLNHDGNRDGTEPRIGISTDNGITWQPGSNAWEHQQGDRTNGGWIAVGADGDVLVWSPEGGSAQARPVSYSTDLGQTWIESEGIPEGAVVSSDRVNPNTFYGLKDGVFYVSTDGGATFTASAAEGLPSLTTSKFKAVPGKEGHIWIAAAADNRDAESEYGLWRSTDFGSTFSKVDRVEEAATIGFGKVAPKSDYMALYSYARINGVMGIFRSDDEGKTWIRINDDDHQFGAANRTITGDPNKYGRVYVGTNGFGIVIGDISATKSKKKKDILKPKS